MENVRSPHGHYDPSAGGKKNTVIIAAVGSVRKITLSAAFLSPSFCAALTLFHYWGWKCAGTFSVGGVLALLSLTVLSLGSIWESQATWPGDTSCRVCTALGFCIAFMLFLWPNIFSNKYAAGWYSKYCNHSLNPVLKWGSVASFSEWHQVSKATVVQCWLD